MPQSRSAWRLVQCFARDHDRIGEPANIENPGSFLSSRQIDRNVRHRVPGIMNADEEQQQCGKADDEETLMSIVLDPERSSNHKSIGKHRQTVMPEPIFKDESIRRQSTR